MNKLLLCLLIVLCSATFYGQDYKYGKVSKEELSQTQHPLEPDASAAVLYRESYTNFNYTQDDGFVLQTKVLERIKIYKQEGYDYATISKGMYRGGSSKEEISGLKAVSYNLVDGKIVESKLQGKNIFKEEVNKTRNVLKFTMPDINDGTIIEYKYTFISPFISSIDEYVFQEEIPVDKVAMRFLAPEYMIYKPYGKGSIPLNMKAESKKRSVNYRYETSDGPNASDIARGNATLEFDENGQSVTISNIPSIKEEPFSTNQNNYASGLQFELAYTQFPNSPVKNYATTWENVASEIYKSDQFGGELKKQKYFKKDIDALVSDVSNASEKAIKIFEFVKQKMNWNEYYGVYSDEGVKKAYNEGVGNVADINLMLNAMLNYAGIESSPVLVSTKANGISFFPTRTGFNYVLAGAKIDGKLYLMDAVDKEGVVNILKPELLNWKGRMVKADGSSRLVELYPSTPAMHNSMVDITITEDLDIDGKSQNRYSKHYAKSERNKFLFVDSEDQLKRLNDRYKSIDVVEHTFKDLKAVNKPLSIEYDFEAEGAIEEIGGKLYITPLLHLATETNFFKGETRNAPIDFGYSWADRYIVNINIPEGYEVESKPEDLAINLTENMGSYRFNINQVGKKLSISLQNSINTPVISPSFYKDLQAYFTMIVEKEAEKVVLKKI